MTAQELVTIRKSTGLNQTDFGKAFGVTRRTISAYEAGEKSIEKWAYTIKFMHDKNILSEYIETTK